MPPRVINYKLQWLIWQHQPEVNSQGGARTLSITTLSIVTFSITTLCIMGFLRHSAYLILSILVECAMLSVIYAEYHLCWVSFMLSVIYAECRVWFNVMLNVVMLSVVMLNVVAPSRNRTRPSMPFHKCLMNAVYETSGKIQIIKNFVCCCHRNLWLHFSIWFEFSR